MKHVVEVRFESKYPETGVLLYDGAKILSTRWSTPTRLLVEVEDPPPRVDTTYGTGLPEPPAWVRVAFRRKEGTRVEWRFPGKAWESGHGLAVLRGGKRR